MSGDHDPTAADVLADWFWSTDVGHFTATGAKCATADLLNSLSAAGLSVVRTGEVPAWMDEWDKDYFPGHKAVIDRETGHFAADCDRPEDRIQRLYVLRPKENQ